MKTYCLSGFSETLDCRPIVLLEPPPKELSCVFCSVVSATPSPLPCGHQACRVCRSEVLLRGNVCPFDKVTFAKDLEEAEAEGEAHGDVALSRVEARCFNFPFGCPFSGTLRELELHFPDDCNHHKVACLNCSKDVLQRLLAEHIFSGCVEHVPLVPPASCVGNGDDSASQRRLSALEKTIEERLRALLVSSAARNGSEPNTRAEEHTSSVAASNGSMSMRNESEPNTLTEEDTSSVTASIGSMSIRNESEPKTLTEEDTSSVVASNGSSEPNTLTEEDTSSAAASNGSMSIRDESEPNTLTEEDTSSAAASNGSVTLHQQVPPSSAQPTPPSQDLPQGEDAISPPQYWSSSNQREVQCARGALYISQYWRTDEGNGAQDGGNSSDDGTLRLGEHYLKLAYTYSKKRNGDVVLLFQLLLREDNEQERPKNGRRSPEQYAKAEPLLGGKLALSLCRPGSSEEHPLPTYALPEGAPEGDGWSVVACTTKLDWQLVERCLDAGTLHFCVRLE